MQALVERMGEEGQPLEKELECKKHGGPGFIASLGQIKKDLWLRSGLVSFGDRILIIGSEKTTELGCTCLAPLMPQNRLQSPPR